MTLDLRSDWRVVAEAVKDYPFCKNCGKPYGNMAFGAEHYTVQVSKFSDCPGYEPTQQGEQG